MGGALSSAFGAECQRFAQYHGLDSEASVTTDHIQVTAACVDDCPGCFSRGLGGNFQQKFAIYL